MAKRRVSKGPRKQVKRLPKLKGADLFEITPGSPKKRRTKQRKRPIPKNELEADEL